jgi:hypothetical protein
MDKILEALGKLLPKDQLKEISAAVNEMVEESKKELEAEYNKNLEEAYKQMSLELAEAEKVAEEGYREAYAIIQDQDARQEAMKEEFERMLEEQYEEAYKMILEERGKNNDLETTMYEEYDSKLNDIKEYIVEKVDQFLQLKGKEIYEQAYRDALNDPRMAEHKVVLDKIIELTSDYLSEEELQFATSSKLEEAHNELEKLRGQVKMMEGRNIRVSAENTKMQQKLNEAVILLRESTKTDKNQQKLNEQKERVRKAANAQGRGHSVTDEKLIAEFKSETEVTQESEEQNTLMENLVADLEFAKKVAGIKK